MTRLEQETTTVFVDADNTLWDTDLIFANAQRNILQRVESASGIQAATNDRLAYVRTLDQALAERHHERLRYPPKLLVRALEAALTGVPAERAARAALHGSGVWRLSDICVNEIEFDFFDDLSQCPPARPGVHEGLHALQSANCFVLVVTEGQRSKVEKTLKGLHLDGLVSRVVEGTKRAELYTRILQVVPSRKRAFMVGDQLDRDIVPAKAAGLQTVYFPGGFRPRWTPDEATVKPDYLIKNFAEISEIVLNEGFPKLSASETGQSTYH